MRSTEPGLFLSFERIPNGWRAKLGFRLSNQFSDMRVSGEATDDEPNCVHPSAQALHRAVVLANQLLTNPNVVALMPPQVQVALQVTRELARAAKRGVLDRTVNGKKLWEHFHGVFRKIARGLADAGSNRPTGAVMGGERLQLCDMSGCVGFRPPHKGHHDNRSRERARGRTPAAPQQTMPTMPIGPTGGPMPGMGPIPGFPPGGSPSPTSGPYALNPWAPFPQPNQWQAPGMTAPNPPPSMYSQPPVPPPAETAHGVPPAPMTDEEYERAFGMPDELTNEYPQ